LQTLSSISTTTVVAYCTDGPVDGVAAVIAALVSLTLVRRPV